jgi:LPXTG-motif cell wall-anchored protein
MSASTAHILMVVALGFPWLLVIGTIGGWFLARKRKKP